MRRTEALAALRRLFPLLSVRYGVTGVALFGSVARDQARPGSDVDVLVDLAAPLSYFDLADMQNALTDGLGANVDLVPRAHMRADIMREIENDLVGI